MARQGSLRLLVYTVVNGGVGVQRSASLLRGRYHRLAVERERSSFREREKGEREPQKRGRLKLDIHSQALYKAGMRRTDYPVLHRAPT